MKLLGVILVKAPILDPAFQVEHIEFQMRGRLRLFGHVVNLNSVPLDNKFCKRWTSGKGKHNYENTHRRMYMLYYNWLEYNIEYDKDQENLNNSKEGTIETSNATNLSIDLDKDSECCILPGFQVQYTY